MVSGISAAAHAADPDDGLVSVAAFELSELAFLSDEPEAFMKHFAMNGVIAIHTKLTTVGVEANLHTWRLVRRRCINVRILRSTDDEATPSARRCLDLAAGARADHPVGGR